MRATGWTSTSAARTRSPRCSACVRSAREEVLLESYIFKDDATGTAFAAELCAAARRGVRVCVLADGFGSFETRRRFWAKLREHGVEARLFHPIGFPPRWLSFRDHRKILVADRAVAFTGGMNIGEEYGSSTPSAGAETTAWRDTHARVEGPAAWEMALVFEEGWRRAGGTGLGLTPEEEDLAAPGARVMVLDSRPGRGSIESASVLSAIVAGARRRVWVTMAYFAPRARAARLIARTARRGVDVRMIFPLKTDVHLVRHAGHGFYSGLLAAGVRVFEYGAAVLPREDDGRRRALLGDRLEQLRLPVLRAQRGVQLRHPRRGDGGDDGAAVRGRSRRERGDRAPGLAPAASLAPGLRRRRAQARAAPVAARG
jgi:cardiolipin synthase